MNIKLINWGFILRDIFLKFFSSSEEFSLLLILLLSLCDSEALSPLLSVEILEPLFVKSFEELSESSLLDSLIHELVLSSYIWPSKHFKQTVWLLLECVPSGHLTQIFDPFSEIVPDSHNKQVEWSEEEYFPAGHSSHVDDFLFENVPSGQLRQPVDPSKE